MEIYVFNPQIELQGILENYFSLTWTRRYSKCGDFYLHAGVTADALRMLKRGNIIWKNDSDEAGYIEYINISLDRLGQETIKARGRLMPGYLGRRIVWGTERLTGGAEAAIRSLVANHAIEPTDPARAIPLLELGAHNGLLPTVNIQTSYSNLLETVENISAASNLGFRGRIDRANKKIVFDVFEGLDRTAGQPVNAPAIFSTDFENVLEQSYVDSLNDFRNVGLVAGAGEGEDRAITTAGTASGLARHEKYIDARDIAQENLTVEEYTELLQGRGMLKLSEYEEIKSFGSKINLNGNLIYKSDFDLGDVVTCMSRRWGVAVDTRITEVEETYENGLSVNVSFGNSMPTITEKIKRAVN